MRKTIIAVSGLVLGAAMVWVLFRSTDWGEVLESIRGISVFWLVLAHVPLMLTFPARIQRWSYIVRATDTVSFRKMFSATQIGFLANFVLLGRVGEAIRALVLTRLTGIKFSKSFALVALDRVTDLIALMAVMTVAVAAYRPTGGVSIPAETFGTAAPITFTTRQYEMGAVGAAVFLVAMIGTFVLLYVSRSFVMRVSDAVLGIVSTKIAGTVNGVLGHFADGLHVFRSPGDMFKSIAWSLTTWGLGLATIFCLLEAFHVDYPWYTPFVIQSILAVFIAAPNTPGFVGQFHVPVVLGLIMTVPTIDTDAAKACAIVFHLVQLPPVGVLGVWCLMREHMDLLQLKSEGGELVQRVDQENAGHNDTSG